ncbi:hypothetical protein OGAPHI_006629 [Ogataea philodendri]|uniref:Aldehyde dehydrogenase domain-containing protein n=1 Tax=Ogataea philodendri TaxID=1378263 RepID=A0A9P8NXG9_9ASCO|nr:uncharacterized protein OGAPHI_006629 [Ogataea philodendri]KAH3661222.1 hypothetical protein OGAPHI_006629 [Ogataea philodendri]
MAGWRRLPKAKVHTRRRSTIPLLFDGAESDHRYIVRSPSGEHLHDVCALKDARLVDKVCESSWDGFLSWRKMPVKEKTEIYSNLAAQLTSLKDEYIQAHLEIGVPGWMSGFNFQGFLDNVNQYKALLTTRAAGVVPVQNMDMQHQNDLSMVVQEPVGPVLSIAPWNAPGILAARSVLAPLTAGCSVIVKSSDLSARISYLTVKAFHEAGVPANAVSLVHCEADHAQQLVDALIAHRRVRKVNFTGSTQVGSSIAAVAGKHLKPVLLELGGKNCSVITKDVADLETAVRTSLWASWAHKGQICMCTDWIFVDESIQTKAFEYISRIGSEMISNDADLEIPQRTTNHALNAKNLVQDALEKGATLLAGTPDFSATSKFQPVVLANVTPAMKVYSTETFAPIVCVGTYNTTNEVVNTINDLDHGLKCSIWSSNHLQAYHLAGQIDAGSVHINSPTVMDEAHLPHGGVNKSGYGRFNSHWGVQEFSYPKLVTLRE